MGADLQPLCDDDLDAIAALIRRSEQFEKVDRAYTVEELREEFSVPYVSLEADSRKAVRDGEIVGWSYVLNPPAGETEERAYLFGDVDPPHRGQGIGRQLLAWALVRANERLADRRHGLPRYIRVDRYEWVEDAHRMYARFGFTPVRWFEELLRPLDTLPAITEPDGVAFEPWPDGVDDQLLALRNTAFADHWGSTPVAEEAWHNLVRGVAGRPDLSWIARDRATGEIVALCLGHRYPDDDVLTGRRDGWIENLATLRSWRGRGIASALLVRTMQTFKDAGLTHAVLGVDADSPTGASRLYRAVGFEPWHRSITHQIELP